MKYIVKKQSWTTLIVLACLAGGIPCNATHNEEDQPDAERIAAEVAEWIGPYQKKTGIKTEYDGDSIYLYGTFGALPSVFSTLDITVAVYGDVREVSFIGYLPTIVSGERRREMIEFIFRGEMEYGISTASLILDEDGRLRCQAWMPFEGFLLQQREAKWRLMGAVVDKLWSFSEGVASVSLGGDAVKAAAGIRRFAAFEGLDEAAELRNAAETDTKIVLERCFEKDANVKVCAAVNEWLDKLSGKNGEVRVGIINARIEDVVRDVGGRYDVLPYSLVVREGMVWNVCDVPETCPRESITEAADVLMKANQDRKHSLYGIDFDSGKIWCHYSLPVSAIPDGDDRRPGNINDALLKTVPILNIARDSEMLHSLIVKVLPKEDDDGPTPSTESSVGEIVPPVALPLLTKMLNAYDAWESARWDLLNTNSIEIATKKRIAGRRYMRYCDDGLTDEVRLRSWPFDVGAFENGLSQKMVCDKYGLYRVRREHDDYGEGVVDDGNVAINPSIRWMNRKMEEWATNALDVAYSRLAQDALVKMLGSESINDGTFCWVVGTNEFFVIQKVDEDHAFESRDYIYMRLDGDGEPLIAATFSSMPDARTMSAVRSCIARNPDGRCNMAALMWNGVVDRGEKDVGIIRLLLELAKQAGIAVAAENLDVMEAPFTR